MTESYTGRCAASRGYGPLYCRGRDCCDFGQVSIPSSRAYFELEERVAGAFLGAMAAPTCQGTPKLIGSVIGTLGLIVWGAAK